MAVVATGIPAESGEPAMDKPRMKGRHLVMTVSYTHLTLPTKA